MKNYDENNIFNKILKNEIECEKIHENQDNLSFNDINKQAPVHVLTITKNKYANFNSFAEIIFLTKYLGDYNISKYGDKILIENNGYTVVTLRK